MVSQRQLFLRHVGQTSPEPLGLEIARASGVHLYDTEGKEYLDLISGISVSNVGHCHPKVVEAIKKQAETYMHLMVYGEFVVTPQVKYAKLLCEQLPKGLDSVYFVNSGAEAADGAVKLARRLTQRPEVLYFKHSYHGSTSGILSFLGDEYFKRAYRPLVPGGRMLEYNNMDDLNHITEDTACIIVEPVQAESGINPANLCFLQKIRERCTETGTLMILDEIQTGFGRTGSLFAFQQYGVVPDILLIAKGMGGGMPIGAFVSSTERMNTFTVNPVLGHITTFGGHPVSCAAATASLELLLEEDWVAKAEEKGQLIEDRLKGHKAIKELRRKGLMIALDMGTTELNMALIQACVEEGLVTDWFLFADHCLRIGPPLCISMEQVEKACITLLAALDKVGS